MFNRRDICEAFNLFAMLYHNGPTSDTYKIFDRLDGIGFYPGNVMEPEDLNDNARGFFDNLVTEHA